LHFAYDDIKSQLKVDRTCLSAWGCFSQTL
jgi:hypothetical protein